MEITCNRCHQAVNAENCYCPCCGLPQLVYATDGTVAQAQTERWDGVLRDASSIDWKPALSAVLKLAIPAGVLCAMLSGMGILWNVLDGHCRNMGSGALSAQPKTRLDHSREQARASGWSPVC